MELKHWFSSSPTAQWTPGDLDSVSNEASEFDLELSAARDQEWMGFGGCFNELGWIALGHLPQGERDAVLDALFDPEGECRFSYCRLPIGASDYAAKWYSHNEHEGDLAMEHFSIDRDHEFLLPFIHAAKARRSDLRLFASPWSPPTWMKRPQAYNYGTLRQEEAVLEAYALYFLKFVRAYREQGLEIEAVHVQNEPNSDQKFPSCVWTGAQMRDFIRDHLGPLFEREGEACRIWAGTIERGGLFGAPDGFNEWANLILSDPQARRFIAGVGYQWAGKWSVARTRAAWPDFPMVQTENECGKGTNTWEYAAYIFDLAQHYISNGVAAYVYWNMVLEPGGQSTWGWKQNSMFCVDPTSGELTRNPEFFVMKHLSRFVVPGARRILLSGRLSANALAFENPDGSRVAIARNPFETPQTISLREGQSSATLTLEPLSLNTFVLA